MRVPILVHAGTTAVCGDRRGEPVTIGIALPRGRARAEGWTLFDEDGRPASVQTRELDRWSDGSTRWLLVDFQADVFAGGPAAYELRLDPSAPPAAGGHALDVRAEGDAIVVGTGPATFHVGRSGRSLLTRVEVNGGSTLDANASALIVTDADGVEHVLEISSARMESTGALRSVARVDGRVPLTAGAHIDVVARLHFFAGLGVVRVELSVTNPRRAHHPGGFWDLGDPGSVHFRDVSVVCTPTAPIETMRASIEASADLSRIEMPLELYQDSSGGVDWDSRNHVDRDGNVAVTFRGYRVAAGSHQSSGCRATPVIVGRDGDHAVALCMPQFWQNFPKAIEATTAALTLRLWPGQSNRPHELQGGERKTHTFFLAFGRDTVTQTPLAWTRAPALATASPDVYEAAGVWRPLSVGSAEAKRGYAALVNVAIEGAASFDAKREAIDEYGWRHFGDIYADHEAVNQPGLVSHYNNQYDAIAGCATRFCETGDRRWWTAMHELARHVADIDIYHCRDDRAAYNHGLFWHTSHYAPAQTATHRAYSRRAGGASGGPSNEHNYTTGLMLHYFLTGCEPSREAVLGLAGWVLDMDDGSQARFRWIERGDTGLASATRDPDYHGPGRGAAYSVNALLDAHRLTGEARYLRKAERLVRRCVHPADDPEALGLLDAERRWSYTVFLQVLGKYLEHRAECGLADGASAYARAALLAYARWMASHERPYLEHPEQLEYPTETWAAQDIRKAAVFDYAAAQTDDDGVRDALLARAQFFFDYAVTTLEGMPTHTLARPTVLLLAYGFQRPLLGGVEASSLPPAMWDEVRPRRFVPYRRRVVRRLIAAAAIIGTAVAAAALAAM